MGIKVKTGTSCPSAACELHGRREHGNLALHGFSKVKWGRRRR
jgi:hypothetical protein